MRAVVNRIVARHLPRLPSRPPKQRLSLPRAAGVVGLVLLAAVPAAGDAEDDWPGQDRWVPSIAVTSGATVQSWSGSINTDCRDPDPNNFVLTDCNPSRPINDPTPADQGKFFGALGDPSDGNNLAVTPFVGGNLQIMTPTIAWLPGRPRLFFAGDLSFLFGTERDVASFRDPSELAEPKRVRPNIPFPEESLLGVGQRVRAKLDDLSFGASAGLAFPFEAFGRRLRLKVSGGWQRQTVKVDSLSLFGLCPPIPFITPTFDIIPGCDVDGVPPIVPMFGPLEGFTRVIRLQEKDKLVIDGIGPGFELEMDTGRVGPVGVSLFAGFQAFYVFSDRRISSSVRQTFGPDGLISGNPGTPGVLGLKKTTNSPPGAAVSHGLDSSFGVAPWLYRGNVGVRFHWVGWPQGG